MHAFRQSRPGICKTRMMTHPTDGSPSRGAFWPHTWRIRDDWGVFLRPERPLLRPFRRVDDLEVLARPGHGRVRGQVVGTAQVGAVVAVGLPGEAQAAALLVVVAGA